MPDAPLATTSLNAILEFDYALNKDETRGFLAGVQYTRVAVDSPLATINPNLVGYVGGYYQWDDNWKFSGQITGMFHPGSNFQAALASRSRTSEISRPLARGTAIWN